MSDPIKKCSICHKEFEQPFHTQLLDFFYNFKEALLELEAHTPYAPKELHQEIAFVQQGLGVLDEKEKPIRKELIVSLENFFQKKLSKSFIKLFIDYLEKDDEPTIEICRLCSQEVEQQEKAITKKLKEIEKDAGELIKKYRRINSEIQKNIEREKFSQIFSEAGKKLTKEIVAELKSFLEPSESTQQDSKSQTNQPKPTSYTPWIIGGVIGAGAITGIVIWLILRNKRKNA